MRCGVLPWCCVALAAVGVGGCLPVLVPPVRVEAGIGSGSALVDAPGRGGLYGSLRGGLFPTQLMRGAPAQPWDWGAGWGIEGAINRRQGAPGEPSQGHDFLTYHGPFVEVGYYPWSWADHSRSLYRAGAFASTEVLWGAGEVHGTGAGLTAGMTVEWTGMADGPLASHDAAGNPSDAFGFGYGQWGFGLYAAGSVREVDREPGWAITVGFTGRLPLAAGLICCVNPFALGHGSSSSSSSTTSESSGSSSTSASSSSNGSSSTSSSSSPSPAPTPATHAPARPVTSGRPRPTDR